MEPDDAFGDGLYMIRSLARGALVRLEDLLNEPRLREALGQTPAPAALDRERLRAAKLSDAAILLEALTRLRMLSIHPDALGARS